MIFHEAHQAMSCGNRVRRSSWDSERFVHIEARRPRDDMDNPWMPQADDIEADDWELMQ